MISSRVEGANLRQAEEDRERALAMLPDADLLLPSSVAGVISAPRNMIRGMNRRAMIASGETSAAVAIARSVPMRESLFTRPIAVSSSSYAAMPRADESDDSFDSLDSDTESESSLPALCEDDDDEEENDSEEEGESTVSSG